MAVYEVVDKQSIAPLFDGWPETMIWSYLQDCMGMAYADDRHHPLSALISLGDFCFFAGRVNDELVCHVPGNLHSDFAIFVPQNQLWADAIARCHGDRAVPRMRYATKKEPGVFDESLLQDFVSRLSPEYELRMIDRGLYEQIVSLAWAGDLCSNYSCYEEYQRFGLGVVALKSGEIVSGASSYTSYPGGIEIEIDTRVDERRRGLALACGAMLILESLDRGLYPSWDAHNKGSLALAEKLGYCFDKEYLVCEVSGLG